MSTDGAAIAARLAPSPLARLRQRTRSRSASTGISAGCTCRSTTARSAASSRTRASTSPSTRAAARPTPSRSSPPAPTRSAWRTRSSLIGLAAKGAEIKSVMSLLNSTGFSVVSLASSGIRTPKDLEGKSLAVSPGDPLGQLFRALAAHNKLDITQDLLRAGRSCRQGRDRAGEARRRAARRSGRSILSDQVQGPGAARAPLRRPRRQHRRHDDPGPDSTIKNKPDMVRPLRPRLRRAPGRRPRRTRAQRSTRR